jgi:hypothetical protein
MFEKPGAHVSTEGRMDAIVENVRELRRLDPRCVRFCRPFFSNWGAKSEYNSMFLSRTVAAEVCMEAKTNEIAFAALNKLDQSGDLLFELSYVSAFCFRELLLIAFKL